MTGTRSALLTLFVTAAVFATARVPMQASGAEALVVVAAAVEVAAVATRRALLLVLSVCV